MMTDITTMEQVQTKRRKYKQNAKEADLRHIYLKKKELKHKEHSRAHYQRNAEKEEKKLEYNILD